MIKLRNFIYEPPRNNGGGLIYPLKSPFRCGRLDITAYQGHRLSLVYRDGHCKPVDTNSLSLFDGFVDDRLW